MYRPPVGIPRRKQTRWQGWLLSLLAHLFLLLLLLRPGRDSGIDYGHRDGSGGAGPSGGGGGSSAGTVGDGGEATLHFVQIAPQSNTAPAVVPVLPMLAPTAVPPPVPALKVVTPSIAAPSPAPTTGATPSATGGSGSGTGKIAGAGAGSGTGGGVGSGEGTGNGSGVGPGTGGGVAKNHPPTLKQFVLPPLPTPSSVRGFKLTAWFDVDSTGKATLLRFTPTPDHDYNNRIRETLLALRFRPAVRANGSALRDTVDIEVLF